jgi:hypothetical protein
LAGAIAAPGAAFGAFAVVPADPLVPALTPTSKDEGPACALRAWLELASCGDNGSNAPRSPLPLTSVSRGAVRPATAHGTAEPSADLTLVLANRRTGGAVRDDGVAPGRAAGTAAVLLRAT